MDLLDYKVYCDMDGVLCDFESQFHKYAKMPALDFKEKYGIGKFWNLIDKEIGHDFWSTMPFMPLGRDLWDSIKEYSPSLLTSPSFDPVSRMGKRSWVKKNLKPRPRILFAYSTNKSKYATSNSILIDDRKENIKAWREKGGIGLLYRESRSREIIERLTELVYEKG